MTWRQRYRAQPGKPRLVVEVEWEDAATANGDWNAMDAVRARTVTCHSSGFLLEVTRRHVTLVQNAGDNGRASDTITIPRACVRVMRRLR